jgi:acyl carrier protein phosphodiesterase
MNYLAHSFLSFANEPILFGQFIADDIKGSQWKTWPPNIQQGILLHRFIDDFTDNHPLLLELRKRLHPTLGKFAGVVLDVLFDHALSLRWEQHSKLSREEWIQNTYLQLQQRYHEMSEKRKFILSAMIRHDWMNMYGTAEGTSQILQQMSRRISLDNPLHSSFKAFETHQTDILSAFDEFFPEILFKSRRKLDIFAP